MTMTKSMKSLVVSAALAGLVAGNAAFAKNANSTRTFSSVINGQIADDNSKDKHSCKGKNSCKGKGGCATDGSKPPA
jgi:phage gp45-like